MAQQVADKRAKPTGFGPALKAVSRVGRGRPSRVVLYAVEGWGKSSIAAHMPDPIFLMSRGEDGLKTLLDNGLVPETAHFEDEALSWEEALAGVRQLYADKSHGFKTLVIDTLNGLGTLCVEAVVQKEFEGSMAKFNDYGRGWKSAPAEWRKLLEALTAVNDSGLSVVLLAHADVVTFKNPEGTDYDRYSPRLPKQFWEPTQEWADMVLFGQLETFVKAEKNKPGAKGKATGGQDRLLYCERTAVADAKNRHGLPPTIYCGRGAEAAWQALAQALVEGRQSNKTQPEPPPQE